MIIDDSDLFYASVPAEFVVQVPLGAADTETEDTENTRGVWSLKRRWEKSEQRHREKRMACEQFGLSACDAVGFDGMMDYAFANENANAWETGPFLLRALRAERAEYKRPSMDPWTV